MQPIEGERLQLPSETNRAGADLLGTHRRPKRQRAPQIGKGQNHYAGRQQVDSIAQPPAGSQGHIYPPQRPSADPQPDDGSPAAGEGYKSFREQSHPQRLRLHQRVVELAAADAAADGQHVVAEEHFEQPLDQGGVAEHEENLVPAPRPDPSKALGQQEHRHHPREAEDQVGDDVDEKKLEVPGHPHEVEIRLHPPAPDNLNYGVAVSRHGTPAFRDCGTRARAH